MNLITRDTNSFSKNNVICAHHNIIIIPIQFIKKYSKNIYKI